MQKEPPWEYSGAEQDAAAIQMLGLRNSGRLLCHPCSTGAVSGAKEGRGAGVELRQPPGKSTLSSVDKVVYFIILALSY